MRTVLCTRTERVIRLNTGADHGDPARWRRSRRTSASRTSRCSRASLVTVCCDTPSARATSAIPHPGTDRISTANAWRAASLCPALARNARALSCVVPTRKSDTTRRNTLQEMKSGATVSASDDGRTVAPAKGPGHHDKHRTNRRIRAVGCVTGRDPRHTGSGGAPMPIRHHRRGIKTAERDRARASKLRAVSELVKKGA